MEDYFRYQEFMYIENEVAKIIMEESKKGKQFSILEIIKMKEECEILLKQK
tara:strand:- start:2685 stop:2837 length:153 start_codon:yes stop_codon:yes gene_type:complete